MILTKSAILLKRLLLIHKVIGMKDILHPPVVAACSREHASHQMIAAVSMIKRMKRIVRIHSELITCNEKCAACSKREVTLSGSDRTCAYSCSRIISCPGCNYAVFRKAKLNKRRGKADVTPVFTAILLTDSDQTIHYRASLPAADWIQFATLNLKKEVINGSGEKVQSENIPIPDTAPHIATATDHFVPQRDRNREAPMAASSPSAPVVPEHHSVSPAPSAPSAKPYFKGSYVSPESDATDERNQKELNFSLDEARVIAEINPQMLSLRELYTVAISYKNTPEQFYKIIDISVKIYPASPVANLNAAAAAIERGNTQAAGRYLQMASHETLAYKNCRGAYELLCNNTYEGIRLLKAAKAEGSEEATYNLKIFFESNQTNIQ